MYETSPIFFGSSTNMLGDLTERTHPPPRWLFLRLCSVTMKRCTAGSTCERSLPESTHRLSKFPSQGRAHGESVPSCSEEMQHHIHHGLCKEAPLRLRVQGFSWRLVTRHLVTPRRKSGVHPLCHLGEVYCSP